MKQYKLYSSLITLFALTASSGCFTPSIRNLRDLTTSSSSTRLYNFKTFLKHLGVGAPGVNDSSSFDQGRNIVTDRNGNTYIIGDSTGNFAGVSAGSSDVFAAKFDVNGNLVWIKHFTPANFPGKVLAANGTDYAYALTIDPNDNIVVAGHCNSNMSGTVSAGQDIFVAKINPSGDMLWLKMINSNQTATILDSSGNENVAAISADSSGNLYLAATVTTGFSSAYGGGATDAVIIKLDIDGNFVWVRQLNNPTFPGFISGAGGTEYIYNVKATYSGAVYFAGQISTGIITGFALGGGGTDAFVGKLDSNGTMQWIKPMTSTFSALIAATGGEDCYSLDVDSTGNAVIAGTSNWVVEAGATYGGGQDLWIAKISSAGNLTWVKQVVDAMSPLVLDDFLIEDPRSVNIDSNNNIYVSGFTSSGFFGANGGGSQNDAFVFKMNSSGTLLWAKQITPAYSPLINSALLGDGAGPAWIDADGNLAIVGNTYSNFGVTNGGNLDPFILHIDSNGNM